MNIVISQPMYFPWVGLLEQVRLANKFVFPLATSKAQIESGSSYNGQVLTWSSQAQNSYHHDYVAADIHVNEGTTVLAAKGGQVVDVRSFEQCDDRHFPAITIKGTDGLYYYYTHLKPKTLLPRVGDVVGTGEPIAQVGSAACAQGSAPHLHLDISRFPIAFRGGFWGEVVLVDPQPVLINAYQELPEK